MAMSYGLEFSLTNAPSKYQAQRELTSEAHAKLVEDWRAQNVVLIDLNGGALGSFYKHLALTRKQLEADGKTLPMQRRHMTVPANVPTRKKFDLDAMAAAAAPVTVARDVVEAPPTITSESVPIQP
jgi:hypothetical protein